MKELVARNVWAISNRNPGSRVSVNENEMIGEEIYDLEIFVGDNDVSFIYLCIFMHFSSLYYSRLASH